MNKKEGGGGGGGSGGGGGGGGVGGGGGGVLFNAMNNIMMSPKMQRSIRINDSQILMLAEKARFDHVLAGYLHKKSSGAAKWTRRYFILFQVKEKSDLIFVISYMGQIRVRKVFFKVDLSFCT